MSRTLFGAVVGFEPTDNEAILKEDVLLSMDDVFDLVEEVDIDDKDWSWIVWRNDLRLYFLISGPISLRAKIAQIDGFSVKPANDIVTYMDRQSNDWFFPRPRLNHSILDRARNWFRDQMSAQFVVAEEAAPEEEIEEKVVGAEPTPIRAKEREKTWLPSRLGRPVSSAPASDEDIDKVRNLLSANDGSGRSFVQVG